MPAVGVLARAAAILDAVEATPRSSGELAHLLGLSASTVYRLVGEMVRYSLLRRTADGTICPGDRFKAIRLAEVSHPVLTRLREITGELLNCGYREVLKGCVSQWWRPITNYMLCYLKVRGCRWVRTQPGHVLNGDFDADPVARERGWWEATSERTLGLTSVSAPVRLEGRTVAAVCAAGPLNRMPTSAGQTWGSAVLEAAAEIEHALV